MCAMITASPMTATETTHTMKTKSYHISNLGSFAPAGVTERDGYVTYHDSDRYGSATAAQLDAWSESRNVAVRNAALTEKAERRLGEWQKDNA